MLDDAPVGNTATDIVGLALGAALGLLLDAVDREVLAPGGEQHDLRIAVLLVGEDAPGGAAGRVVLLLPVKAVSADTQMKSMSGNLPVLGMM
jgi:hypothetical protein